MPIGLPATGRRAGATSLPRRCSGAPTRGLPRPAARRARLPVTYDEAARLHRLLADGRGLSVQTWNLVARIREVDAVADDPRLVEVHPELSFAVLSGGALPSKKTAAGRAARLAALGGWLPARRSTRCRAETTGWTHWPARGRLCVGWSGRPAPCPSSPGVDRDARAARCASSPSGRSLVAGRMAQAVAGASVSWSRLSSASRGDGTASSSAPGTPVVRVLGVPQRRDDVDGVDPDPRTAVDVPVAGSHVDH